jgi:aminotransferase in exopolysaccharide biosynthesis
MSDSTLKYGPLIDFIRGIYGTDGVVPLHEPRFTGNEKRYLCETIDSTFVSSVGEFVNRFEQVVATFTGSKRAVATVNGTAALQTALTLAGVRRGDLVITPSLNFVATCNVLHHLGARPLFIDVTRDSLGLSVSAVEAYLSDHADVGDDGICRLKQGGQVVRAVVPMHTFGHPVDIEALMAVCSRWQLAVVEDAAESLGSTLRGRHTGTCARFGILSFNGNKVITTGGGGMVLCQSEADADRAKHLTTTAKKHHAYEFDHDEPGFNFRMPNLNAALGCAQMESLPVFLQRKRELASAYQHFLTDSDLQFVVEPAAARSNYWLNAVIAPDAEARQRLLQETNACGVMTRPVWKLMHHLPMFAGDLRGDLTNSEWLEGRVVNLPSSVPLTTGALAGAVHER